MNTIRISATAARNRFFSLLDEVVAGKEVIIEKDRKVVAVMKSNKTASNLEAVRAASKKVHGIWKNYSVEEIAPARSKDAWKGFGKWDDDGFMLSDKRSDESKTK